VRQATAGAQVPWTEASLTERTLVLNPAPTRPSQEDAIAEFNRALDIDDPLQQRLALAQFARAHQDTPFAQLAGAYLDRLEQAAPQPGIQLASFEQTVADRQRIELVAGSAAAPLANEVFASLHPSSGRDAEPGDGATVGAVETPPTATELEDQAATAVEDAPPPRDAGALLWPLVAAANRPEHYAQFLALFPDDSHAPSASAGLQLAALAGDGPRPTASPAASDEPEPLLVRVVVGTGPVTVPLPATERSLVLQEPPRHGKLRAFGADGSELDLARGAIAPERLEYLPPLALRQGVDAALLGLVSPEADDEVAALDGPPADAPADAPEDAAADAAEAVEMAELDGGGRPSTRSADAEAPRAVSLAAGEPYLVQFEITVDDCDRLAGARFDRQGVVLGNFPTEIDTGAAIDACEQALETYPDVPRFAFQLARALEEAGVYERAAALYDDAGAAGHVLAITRLGYLHLVGLGVPADVDKAITFFESAAAAGEPYAMNSLARLYASGEGVEADRDKAIDWYLQAAARGHTFAYNNLGYLLAEAGEADRALPLFQASAEAGDVYGFNNMGYAYQNGVGVEPDLAQAIEWYERAAAGGQPNAPINLGFIYRDGGPGLEADPSRAAFWFAEAAKGGNPWGSLHLASLHAQGALGEAPDPVLAARLLARVAWIDAETGRHATQQNYGGAGDAARERFAQLPTRVVVQAVQTELARLGYDPGPADGLAGPRTEAAIQAFLDGQAPALPSDLPPIELLAELVRLPTT
jgi:TPR repeat protein